jgi:hypothetical protein
MAKRDVDKSRAWMSANQNFRHRNRLDAVNRGMQKSLHGLLKYLSPQDKAYIGLRLWVLEEGAN